MEKFNKIMDWCIIVLNVAMLVFLVGDWKSKREFNSAHVLVLLLMCTSYVLENKWLKKEMDKKNV